MKKKTKERKFVMIKCPLCLGSGKIRRRAGYLYTVEQVRQARKLYVKGKSLREIAKIMNIKHPQTIANLIRRKIS